MVEQKTFTSRIFDVLNILILSFIALLCLLPFIYIIATSLATAQEIAAKPFLVFPSKISYDAYMYILSSNTILRSLGISLFVTAIGTFINISMTALMAYPLSRKNLRGRRLIQMLVVFTMMFNGGMIPSYLVVSSLRLVNSFWALWLPGAISAFNLLLLRNFFQEIPEELIEAAKIDGCNEWRILAMIVLPLSLPSLAVFSLFYAVGHWNSWFNAVLYISDMTKWPIQVWLRQIVLQASGGFTDSGSVEALTSVPQENVVKAVIVIATVPILIVYPFLQKYFTKGIMVGSIKG
jgi:putative aldouronate transport system permease protein